MFYDCIIIKPMQITKKKILKYHITEITILQKIRFVLDFQNKKSTVFVKPIKVVMQHKDVIFEEREIALVPRPKADMKTNRPELD